MARRKAKARRGASRRIRRTPEQLIADLEKRLAEMRSQTTTAVGFSPDAVRKERERIEVSAADYAELVGVSSLTIYNWEKGGSRPQRAQLEKWAAVKGISKREAWKRLGYA